MWALGSLKRTKKTSGPLAAYGAVEVFYRLLMEKGTVIFSKEYQRVKNRNSYTVSYHYNEKKYGQILYFFYSSAGCYAVIQNLVPCCLCSEVLNVDNTEAIDCSAMLVPCILTEQLHMAKISSIMNKCLCIEVDDLIYLCELDLDIFMD